MWQISEKLKRKIAVLIMAIVLMSILVAIPITSAQYPPGIWPNFIYEYVFAKNGFGQRVAEICTMMEAIYNQSLNLFIANAFNEKASAGFGWYATITSQHDVGTPIAVGYNDTWAIGSWLGAYSAGFNYALLAVTNHPGYLLVAYQQLIVNGSYAGYGYPLNISIMQVPVSISTGIDI